MKQLGFSSAWALSAVYVVTCLAADHETLPQGGMNVAWTKELSEPDRRYGIVPPAGVAVAMSMNGEVLLAANSLPTKGSYPERFEIFRIYDNGRAGSIISATEWHQSNVLSRYEATLEVLSIAALQDNSVMIVAQDENYRPQLIKLTPEGNIVFAKDIEHEFCHNTHDYDESTPHPKQPPKVKITRIVTAGDNSCLLIGSEERRDRENSDALAIRVNGEGCCVWKKTYDMGFDEHFTSGVLLDGGFLLAANSGSYEWVDIGTPSAVWLLKCNEQGNVISEAVYSGRNADLVQWGAGRCGLVYDKEHGTTREIWVAQLLSDLSKRWEKAVHKWNDKLGFETFYASLPHPDRLLIAGCVTSGSLEARENSLLLKQYDVDGGMVGSLMLPAGFAIGNSVHLVTSLNTAYVVWRAWEMDMLGHEDREIIKIMAIRLNASGSKSSR